MKEHSVVWIQVSPVAEVMGLVWQESWPYAWISPINTWKTMTEIQIFDPIVPVSSHHPWTCLFPCNCGTMLPWTHAMIKTWNLKPTVLVRCCQDRLILGSNSTYLFIGFPSERDGNDWSRYDYDYFQSELAAAEGIHIHSLCEEKSLGEGNWRLYVCVSACECIQS